MTMPLLTNNFTCSIRNGKMGDRLKVTGAIFVDLVPGSKTVIRHHVYLRSTFSADVTRRPVARLERVGQTVVHP